MNRESDEFEQGTLPFGNGRNCGGDRASAGQERDFGMADLAQSVQGGAWQ
jgi:hypothetical protein